MPCATSCRNADDPIQLRHIASSLEGVIIEAASNALITVFILFVLNPPAHEPAPMMTPSSDDAMWRS
jgi:hypothetical protein